MLKDIKGLGARQPYTPENNIENNNVIEELLRAGDGIYLDYINRTFQQFRDYLESFRKAILSNQSVPIVVDIREAEKALEEKGRALEAKTEAYKNKLHATLKESISSKEDLKAYLEKLNFRGKSLDDQKEIFFSKKEEEFNEKIAAIEMKVDFPMLGEQEEIDKFKEDLIGEYERNLTEMKAAFDTSLNNTSKIDIDKEAQLESLLKKIQENERKNQQYLDNVLERTKDTYLKQLLADEINTQISTKVQALMEQSPLYNLNFDSIEDGKVLAIRGGEIFGKFLDEKNIKRGSLTKNVFKARSLDGECLSPGTIKEQHMGTDSVSEHSLKDNSVTGKKTAPSSIVNIHIPYDAGIEGRKIGAETMPLNRLTTKIGNNAPGKIHGIVGIANGVGFSIASQKSGTFLRCKGQEAWPEFVRIKGEDLDPGIIKTAHLGKGSVTSEKIDTIIPEKIYSPKHKDQYGVVTFNNGHADFLYGPRENGCFLRTKNNSSGLPSFGRIESIDLPDVGVPFYMAEIEGVKFKNIYNPWKYVKNGAGWISDTDYYKINLNGIDGNKVIVQLTSYNLGQRLYVVEKNKDLIQFVGHYTFVDNSALLPAPGSIVLYKIP